MTNWNEILFIYLNISATQIYFSLPVSTYINKQGFYQIPPVFLLTPWNVLDAVLTVFYHYIKACMN